MVISLKKFNINGYILKLRLALLVLMLFSLSSTSLADTNFKKLIIGQWGESENNGESFWSVYEYFNDHSVQIRTILPDTITEVFTKGTYSIDQDFICTVIDYTSHPKLISIGEKSCIEVKRIDNSSIRYKKGVEFAKLFKIDNAKTTVNLVNTVPTEKAQAIKNMIESSGGIRISHNTIEETKKSVLSKIETLYPGMSKQNLRKIENEIINLIEHDTAINRDLLCMLTTVYNKYFTHEEINNYLKFYNSPSGKKLTELSSTLINEVSIASLGWGKKIKPVLIERIILSIQKEKYLYN